ncbi:uncharacterized protein LOC110949666 isoform X1 [Acanthochromis polyacanthus]|uniref:uncharacterized protein LOC110949666 isoform X1 n=1 Tax=Acanthochromis polyacanthus TaxID=80966 RepID=UPI002234AB8C|nr:uncharacterized protein LOC110949666 isoform X1 [Acanthochromis polyacanthus]XP_051813221.1 uncharacterized protein LOC110949666 isoform X1 [Acanthochromis polyacanthus]
MLELLIRLSMAYCVCFLKTLQSFALISCYLPPETSTFGRNAECFFGHLLSLLYRLDVDCSYLCGDFNARISNLKDYIDTDEIPIRNALDLSSNKHGEAFIEFLKDAKCCVLNGRLNSDADNFTSASVRGKAVVDYIITPHKDIKSCLEINVYTPSELAEKIGSEALDLIGPQSRLPDHSLLSLKFRTGEFVLPKQDNSNLPRKIIRRCFSSKFLSTDDCAVTLTSIQNRFVKEIETQQNMDTTYKKLCDIIHKEMGCSERKTGHRPKYYKINQPYWNEELHNLWTKARVAEKLYLKSRVPIEKITLKCEFKKHQQYFDRKLRFIKRNFRRGQSITLQNQQLNSKLFWREINKLGPQNSKMIPMEVVTANGEVCFDKETIMMKWEHDYSALYGCHKVSFNDDFLKQICLQKVNLESEMLNTMLGRNDLLNLDITVEEVQRTISSAKPNKAVGIEQLPNEALKAPSLVNVLHCLFQACFDHAVIPSVWYQSVIKPIPKSTKLDPREPLNYRGISLISTVYKLYSAILNCTD